MSAYVIAHIEVTDPAAYEEYKVLAAEAIAAHGGRYLVRGGPTELLDGPALPGRTVIVEFENIEAARRYYKSDLNAAARSARARASSGSIILVDGVS